MGVIRKSMSLGTVGLIDFRSDKERIARYTRQSRNAIRAQSLLIANQHPAQEQQVIAPQQPKLKLHEKLQQDPSIEPKMWMIYAVVTLICVIPSPATLVISIPVGIYLFYVRQLAARTAKQRDYNRMANRYEALDAPTQPIPIVRNGHGRHSAA